MPGTLMMKALRSAMLQKVPWELFLQDGLALALMALGVFFLVGWRISRWERR